MDAVVAMVEGVKALGMETCMTLRMLDSGQAARLGEAGLDYYNHNIDTSVRYYGQIISTHSFAMSRVGVADAVSFERDARVISPPEEPRPHYGPINMLIPIPDTPLAKIEPIAPIAFVRTIALALIMMPKSYVRLSAGRTAMTDEMQALCLFASANSIFVGDTLLTAGNPGEDQDAALFRRLGIEAMELGVA